MLHPRQKPKANLLMILPKDCVISVFWLVLLQCLGVSSVHGLSLTAGGQSKAPFFSIPRVKASDFDQYMHYYHEKRQSSDGDDGAFFYETPVIVEGALSSTQCEALCDTIVAECGPSPIDLQRKRSAGTDIYPVTLEQGLNLLMSSKHGDSVFAFCEGLLQENSDSEEALEIVRSELRQRRENIFQTSNSQQNDQEMDDPDWFEYFPVGAKPSDCLILAGEGATSTLHRDPFEWTGTSICLEGSKIWRFAPPPGEKSLQEMSVEDTCIRYRHQSGVHSIDEVLNAYRLDSVAWDEDNDKDTDSFTLSAGWQSDFSFYDNRHKSVPTARELADIEYEQSETKKVKVINEIATDPHKLRPNTKEIANQLWSGVQKSGDLIVIPAYWWHQTYALEPSLAVASQRCGAARDASRVIDHILGTVGDTEGINIPSILTKKDGYQNENPQDVVDELFSYLAKVKQSLPK